MSEKEYIEICKRLIETKTELPPHHMWKQRDFEYLTDLIFEKTETRVSVSTLKRIWKNGDLHLPHVYTLNALARFAGYESWSAFKQQQSHHENTIRETPVNGKKFKISIPVYSVLLAIAVAAIVAFIYLKPPPKHFKESEVIFKSRKNLSAGVPNTVVFEYDISKLDFDSAFIQHSWDERMRARISKDNHFQTFIYYYPGFHTAKLIINDSVIKTEKVSISTKSWQGMVDGISADSLPQYISANSFFTNGQLYASKETLLKNGINISDKLFWLNYFNVGGLEKVDGENFSFETRIKNSLDEGGLTCQYFQLNIICEQGRISIPFCNPGCIANIHLHVAEVFKDGSKNDLSPFGIDLSTWRSLKIKTVDKKLDVYVDGERIFQLAFKKDLGPIAGFHYQFYGCGAVADVKLYNANNGLSFQDKFDTQ